MDSCFNESLEEAWIERFGRDVPVGLDVDSCAFLNHRSVRKYSDRTIPREMVQYLVAAAQSASTSSNLQTWSVVTVTDEAKKSALSIASGGQKQVLNAPLLCVFLADLHRLNVFASKRGLEPDALDTVEMFMVALVDTALAAERMVCAAEAQGLGVCYIGGMRNRPDQVKEILNLPDMTFGVFGLCLGYPAEGSEGSLKPRLAQDQVWFENEYPSELDSNEYDERAGRFFASQGMDMSTPWSTKCGERTMLSGLSGRENLLEFLQSQGFLRR